MMYQGEVIMTLLLKCLVVPSVAIDGWILVFWGILGFSSINFSCKLALVRLFFLCPFPSILIMLILPSAI